MWIWNILKQRLNSLFTCRRFRLWNIQITSKNDDSFHSALRSEFSETTRGERERDLCELLFARELFCEAFRVNFVMRSSDLSDTSRITFASSSMMWNDCFEFDAHDNNQKPTMMVPQKTMMSIQIKWHSILNFVNFQQKQNHLCFNGRHKHNNIVEDIGEQFHSKTIKKYSKSSFELFVSFF